VDATDLDALDGTSFLTSLDGTIEAVGANRWNNFAKSNGAPELTDQSVIGRSLFEFIAGEDVKSQLHHVMSEVAKSDRRTWVMPLNCDSPSHVRNFRQSVTQVVSQGKCSGLLFQTIELDSRQRPPVNLFDLETMMRRVTDRADFPMIKICGWCQKVQNTFADGVEWLDGETYYAKGGSSRVQITHGVCPPCNELVLRSLRD